MIRAIRLVLRPLVRLMLAGGVTYQVVSELLKEVFVEVADREFRLDAARPSDSRISLLTGVHRKDVRRLRGVDHGGAKEVPLAIPFSARLIASWLGDERFTDEHGRPRRLPRSREDGGQASFEDLVTAHSTDCRPRVILDEWLNRGMVEIDDHGRVRLLTDAFVPADGLDEKLHYFANHLHDHAATATANLLGTGVPQLERSVMYEGMSEAAIAKLNRRARQLAATMLEDLNRLAIELDASEAVSIGARQRFTCGVYFHSEAVPADVRSAEQSAKAHDQDARGAASIEPAVAGAEPIASVR